MRYYRVNLLIYDNSEAVCYRSTGYKQVTIVFSINRKIYNNTNNKQTPREGKSSAS